jgi:glutamine phosphoribosylpyrophosphate amidotransferase
MHVRAHATPQHQVLNKNRYVGRSFIEPTTFLRQSAVARKFSPLVENIAGKRIVLIDDSIVRGNTMGSIVKLLRKAGATEVHVRIASPPLKFPCYMGINIPDKDELIANRMTMEEMKACVASRTTLACIALFVLWLALWHPRSISQYQSLLFAGTLESTPWRISRRKGWWRPWARA